MDDEVKLEWMRLAERLYAAGPDKFHEVLVGMRDVVEATEIIAGYDWQLMHRGRPRKRYHA